MVSRIRKNIVEILISFGVSIAYLFIYAFSTSPLYFYSANDSAVYILLGKFLKDGLLMYRDFFEHKGPLIFFIEYIGSSLFGGGRLGAFVVQTIFMTITILGLYKVSKLFLNTKRSIIITFLSLLVLNTFFEGGNLTEEFCLPAIIVSLYFLLKYMKNENVKAYNYKYAVIYGICFSYCAFMRLTNALPICCFILVIFIELIVNKKWIELLKSAIAFLIGTLIIFIPIMIYCICNNVFNEMIYCTFLYNFMYVSSGGEVQKEVFEWIQILYFIPLAMVLIVGTIGIVRKAYRNISIALVLCGFVGIVLQLSGRPFLHYLIIWVPIISISIIMALEMIKVKTFSSKLIIVIICFTMIWIGYKNVRLIGDANHIFNDNTLKKQDANAKDIVKELSASDRKNFLAYNTDVYFNVSTDIDPCYKYYANQDWLSKSDNKVGEDFKKFLKSGKAKYIVAGEKIDNQNIINSHYKLKKQVDNYRLYQFIK